MASIAMLIWGPLANALAFTGSSYLFHRLSADNIDAERKRHDAAIEKVQKAQIEWAHKHQRIIDFINNQQSTQVRAKSRNKVYRVKRRNERISWGIWPRVTTTTSRTCAEWFLHPKRWTALQRVGIHSVEYDWNLRSFVLSRELNYITIS